MKATSLLERQHREVDALFDKLVSGQFNARAALALLADNIMAHILVEEELLYPAFGGRSERFLSKWHKEHVLIEFALERLLDAYLAERRFDAELGELRELLDRHAEAEEADLFREIERVLDVETLDDLGARMAVRFADALTTGRGRMALQGVLDRVDSASAS